MLHKSEEDYIKYIYEASMDKKAHLTIKEIASYFSYSEQSVNEMIKKLDKKGYVKYLPYQGVKLVKKGQNEAIRMIRSHRIWEVFLEKHLGYSWEDVHDEAERLEHAGSEKLIEKLYTFIGEPLTCQHGNPIPNLDGQIDKIKDFPLSSFQEGQDVIIKRVKDNKMLLKYLNHLNIQIEDIVHIHKVYHSLNMLEMIHKNQKIALNIEIGNQIYGETY